MAAPEAMGEFSHYNGDCVWAAVLMAAHKLNPGGWPLDYNLLDSLTQQAIAQKIGVGSEGQANRQQLEYMLNLWGFVWTSQWKNTTAIPADTLANILLDSLSAGRPVLLGFSNGQALPGDERGLQGHEIAALRLVGLNSRSGNLDVSGYACGDGDNRTCIDHGLAVTYTITDLINARCNSAYTLIAAPTGPGGTPGAAGGTTRTATPGSPISTIVKVAYAASANDGFLPIAQGLDDVQQFDAFDITNPVGSIAGNLFPFFARLLIVLIGIILIVGVISYYFRRALATAGQDAAAVAPLAAAVA